MGNIPEIWFTVSSTIVTCVLGMLGSLKLFDLRSNRLNSMIKKYGKRYLLLILLLILIQVLQFYNSTERNRLNKVKYILEEPSLFDKDDKFSSTSLVMMPIRKTTEGVKVLYFYIAGTYYNLSMSKIIV